MDLSVVHRITFLTTSTLRNPVQWLWISRNKYNTSSKECSSPPVFELERITRYFLINSGWISLMDQLITLLIGSNDLCASCTNLIGHTVLSPEAFETFLRFNMEVIRRALPRTIVNVVQLLNISQVYELTRNVPHCAKLRKSGLIFECTCAFLEGANGNDARAKMDLMAHEYNKRIEKVALYYQDLNDTSFTVRVDPLLSKVKLSEWPLDYLSSLDCFHPSLIAHEKLAVGVW